jgi:saccharopine dehydrogenase-like NADP-dependent oxidoreductase
MRIAVIGLGAVGARAARQLASTDGVDAVVLRDERPERLEEVAGSLGPVAVAEPAAITAPPEADAVVLAVPSGTHAALASELVDRDVPVVSASDSMGDARALLDLGPVAKARGLPLVVGAAFSPGMTCVLARHAASGLDEVDEVHVARLGTGGPACARQHHRALAGTALDWRDGGWLQRQGGSGRELCWFPDPVGAADCYRAALPDALLLVQAFPGVERITARLAATRRDRLTARLPMLRKPHPEGAVGAVRVEVRGRRGRRRETRILGAMDRPAVAAGAVAAVVAVAAARGELATTGAAGLAQLVEPVGFLSELARRGVKAAVFEGAN